MHKEQITSMDDIYNEQWIKQFHSVVVDVDGRQIPQRVRGDLQKEFLQVRCH